MTFLEIEQAVAAAEISTSESLAAPPSEEQRARLIAALERNEQIRLALQSASVHLTQESHRLTQIQTGLQIALGVPPKPEFDYRG
jgi:hypothetical protein